MSTVDIKTPAPSQPKPTTVEMQRLYAKEITCKVPHGFQAFQSEQTDVKPETQTEMNINSQPLGQDTYEVTLQISLTTKIEQRTAYTATIQQACVVKTPSKDEKQLSHLINVYIPNLIYPYARKALADVIGSVGFPPVFLPLIDFAAQAQQQATQQKGETTEVVH